MERVRPPCYEENVLKLPYFAGYSDSYEYSRYGVCDRCQKSTKLFLGMHFPSSSEKGRVLDFECFWKEMGFGTNEISIDLIYGIDLLTYDDQKLVVDKVKWYSKQLLKIAKKPAYEIFNVDGTVAPTSNTYYQNTWQPILMMSMIKIERLKKFANCFICQRFIKIGDLNFVIEALAQNAHYFCAFTVAPLIWGTLDMLNGYETFTDAEKSLLQYEYDKKIWQMVAYGKTKPMYLSLFGYSVGNPIVILSTIKTIALPGSTDFANSLCPTCMKPFSKTDVGFLFNYQSEHPACIFERAIMIFDTPEDIPSWNILDKDQQTQINLQYAMVAKLAPMKTMVYLNPMSFKIGKNRVEQMDVDVNENVQDEELLKNQLTQMTQMRSILSTLSMYEINQLLKCNQLKEQNRRQMALEQAVDIIMFGAPVPCSICKGSVVFNIGERCYTCTGRISAFTLCTFSSKQVERTECAFPSQPKFLEIIKTVSKFPKISARLYAGNNLEKLKIPVMPFEIMSYKERMAEPGQLELLCQSHQSKEYCIKKGSAVSMDLANCKEVHVSRESGNGRKYEAFLTLVNMQKNQNTIKHIVILEDDCEDKIEIAITTSRTGTTLETRENIPFETRKDAIEYFENCFNNLTGSTWERRDYYVKKHDKFYYLDIYAPEIDNALKTTRGKTELKVMKTVAPEHYESLLVQFTTDSPIIGNVSEKIQNLAMTSLQQLMELVENRTANYHQIVDLTNTVYTYFPVCIGFEMVSLDSIDKIEKIMERLYEVKPIENVPRIHPCDILVDKLQAELTTLTNPFELITIDIYHQNTQGTTHSSKTVLKDIFAINRFGHPNHTFPGQRMLLWHGTSKANLPNILERGLLIRPFGKTCRSMFGTGIYFADCFSKSYNYVAGNSPVKYMLLCEVYVGVQHKTYKPMTDADIHYGIRDGKFDSVKGMGKFRPNSLDTRDLDGVTVPCGKLEDYFATHETTYREKSQTVLAYNEYIVYDPKRVKLRYLVVVQSDDVKAKE